MFFNKEIFLKNATQNKALFEYTFAELKNSSDAERRARSKGITTFFEGVEQGPDGQARAVFKVPSQTDRSRNYAVTVAIIVPKTSLFAVAKAKWDPAKFSSILKSANIKVHCTCYDFLFGGQKYNLGPQGKYKGSLVTDKTQPTYKSMNPTAPDYTDPQRTHVLCKHCIAVATNFGANAFNIMKSIRKFTVSVETDPKKTKDMDDGKRPLKKDIELVDLDQEKTNKITEGLIHGTQMVNDEEGSTLEKDNQIPVKEDEVTDSIVEENPTDEIQPSATTPPKVAEVKTAVTAPTQLEKDKVAPKPETVDSDLNPVEEPTAVPLEKDKEETNAKDTRDANELVGKSPVQKTDAATSTNPTTKTSGPTNPKTSGPTNPKAGSKPSISPTV